MTSSSRSIISDYSYDLLYNLVLDIEKYPEFVPWCIGARIIERNEIELKAELVAKYQGFSYKYTSCVICDYNNTNSSIIAKMLVGPFKFLHTKWSFIRLENFKVKISFDIEFEFESFLLENLAKLLINKVTDKIMDAFLHRAKIIYDNQKRIK